MFVVFFLLALHCTEKLKISTMTAGTVTQLLRVLGLLCTLSLAKGCAYEQMKMPYPDDWMYRYCAVGVSAVNTCPWAG